MKAQLHHCFRYAEMDINIGSQIHTVQKKKKTYTVAHCSSKLMEHCPITHNF